MRRGLVVLLLGLSLLCVGCQTGDSTMQEAVAFRAALVQADGGSFRAEVTAEFDQRTETFLLDCAGSVADATLELCVLAPETIADIQAKVTDSGASIVFDAMAVDFGLLANGQVSPVAAPALVFHCWHSGYISAAGTEDGLHRVSYEDFFDEMSLNVDTWFENGIPIYAEVCYNGARILKLTLTHFTLH